MQNLEQPGQLGAHVKPCHEEQKQEGLQALARRFGRAKCRIRLRFAPLMARGSPFTAALRLMR